MELEQLTELQALWSGCWAALPGSTSSRSGARCTTSPSSPARCRRGRTRKNLGMQRQMTAEYRLRYASTVRTTGT
jgi:hypothetical protein